MSSTPTQRIVPGAPPPPPISANKSSQKKKKKTGATATAVVEDTSEAPSPLTTTQNLESVSNGASNQGTPPAPSTPTIDASPLQKLPLTVELVNKRLKATQKKVKRIKDYSASGAELNTDQMRSLASLPALEAVAKELEEVKKALELHESEVAKEESAKRAAADEVQKAAIARAVAEAKVTSEATARLLLTFTCLPTMIQNSHPLISSAGVTETESFVIVSAAETLAGEESQSKEEIISGFFSGEGELQGVTYSRLIEITHAVKEPRQHPTEEGVVEGVVHDPASGADATENGHTGGLLFVHESELDNEVGNPAVDNVGAPPVGGAVPYEAESTLVQQPPEVAELSQPSGPIDWSAEEEHDLPPISGLQESFGGEPQPTATVTEDQAPPEDDGFTTTHGGRGRGPRGERRGGRGYRAEGGGRGYGRGGHGDRGGRGSYRGRGDGEYRGRGEGYRGRGDGEWRGRNEGYRGRGDGYDGYRGRGRGRGEGRGGAPPQTQQE